MAIFNSYFEITRGYPILKPPGRSSLVGQDDMRIFSLRPDVANIANPESGDEGQKPHVFQDQMGRSPGLQQFFKIYNLLEKSLCIDYVPSCEPRFIFVWFHLTLEGFFGVASGQDAIVVHKAPQDYAVWKFVCWQLSPWPIDTHFHLVGWSSKCTKMVIVGQLWIQSKHKTRRILSNDCVHKMSYRKQAIWDKF
jgi:hypothetical protein